MASAWYVLLASMLTAYVVLDGFDFGAGIVHLFVAENDDERRTVLAAIGPLWDGNEVWLIASGGTLVYAFPKAYAAAFSGFYLPLMMALWLLVLRGIAIEFRGHHDNRLWHQLWDVVFAGASMLMALVLGVALGNVVRGVPLDETGYFHAPLFTHFRTAPTDLGAIDWYTALVGIFATVALGAHGAIYLHWKTTGALQARCAKAATALWVAVMVLGIGVTVATGLVQPHLFARLGARPASWPLVLLILAGLALPIPALRKGREAIAFAGSALLLVSMLVATAAGLYPTILRSSIDDRFSLDAFNASTGSTALTIGLFWWIPALLLAIGYFAYLFRSFRGKVRAGEGRY